MKEEISFTKLIYLFMIVYNLIAMGLILSFNSFIEPILFCDTIIISIALINQTLEKFMGLYIRKTMK